MFGFFEQPNPAIKSRKIFTSILEESGAFAEQEQRTRKKGTRNKEQGKEREKATSDGGTEGLSDGGT